MDIVSYLLGKQTSGGGSSHDWSAIGYSDEPSFIKNGYDYAVEIKNDWIPATSLQYKFQNDYNLVFMPYVDTSTTTIMFGTFMGCVCLKEVALLDTSNVTSTNSMFSTCYSLESVPKFNTQNVTDMQSMFSNNYSLTDVPQFNAPKVKYMNNMFNNCRSLSDASLDNILLMCINATSYTGTKTLARLGLTAEYYPTTRIQALPHYQDFIDAGWTIGY